MPRLVSLPDKHRGAGSARLWFNPEHVVSLIPKLTTNGTSTTLSVELKLTGLPASDAWIGDFESVAAADTAWQKFLDQITGT